MESPQYTEPVSRLLTCGSLLNNSGPIDYRNLGFSQEDIPELIKMSADEDLQWADSESDEVWAPIHAWRALGQLQAVEAVPSLIGQIYRIDDDDEWAGEELPDAFGMIGEPAIQGLKRYLSDRRNSTNARTVASNAVAKIGTRFPETREACIAVVETELAQFGENNPEFNGLLISSLLDLRAVEALSTIEVAYQRDCVDLQICGDFEDVEISLGVKEKRTTPKPNFLRFELPAGQVTKKKIGRNEPCPCGSGKKHKKCCFNK